MTTIIYKIKGGFGINTAFRKDGTDVTVKVGERLCGTLKIGEMRAEVVDGAARMNLSSLPDGVYTPVFSLDSREIRLEAIRKMGEKLTRYTSDRNLTVNMLERIDRLEANVASLECLVAELDKRVRGNGIFE